MSALFFVLVSGWLCLHKMLACSKNFNNLSHNLWKGGSSATMTKCCEWHTSKDMLMLKKLTVLSEQVYILSYRGFFFAIFFMWFYVCWRHFYNSLEALKRGCEWEKELWCSHLWKEELIPPVWKSPQLHLCPPLSSTGPLRKEDGR